MWGGGNINMSKLDEIVGDASDLYVSQVIVKCYGSTSALLPFIELWLVGLGLNTLKWCGSRQNSMEKRHNKHQFYAHLPKPEKTKSSLCSILNLT